jgi:hypothetical protein
MIVEWLEYGISLYEPALQIYAALWVGRILCRYIEVPGLRLILEACLYNWTAVLCFPIYPTGFTIFYTVRFLLNTYIKWESNGKTSIMPGRKNLDSF